MDETCPIRRAFKWVDETYLVSTTLSHLVYETHFDYDSNKWMKTYLVKMRTFRQVDEFFKSIYENLQMGG